MNDFDKDLQLLKNEISEIKLLLRGLMETKETFNNKFQKFCHYLTFINLLFSCCIFYFIMSYYNSRVNFFEDFYYLIDYFLLLYIICFIVLIYVSFKK